MARSPRKSPKKARRPAQPPVYDLKRALLRTAHSLRAAEARAQKDSAAREASAAEAGRVAVKPILEGYRRWVQNTVVSSTSRLQWDAMQLGREMQRISDNLDHLHNDLVALREHARIPDPKCYADRARQRGARRVIEQRRREQEPPADSPRGSDGTD